MAHTVVFDIHICIHVFLFSSTSINFNSTWFKILESYNCHIKSEIFITILFCFIVLKVTHTSTWWHRDIHYEITHCKSFIFSLLSNVMHDNVWDACEMLLGIMLAWKGRTGRGTESIIWKHIGEGLLLQHDLILHCFA